MFLTDEQNTLALEIAELLIARGEKVAVSESTTGGLVSAALLSVGGASKYFAGGGVVYTLASRTALAGAPVEHTPTTKAPRQRCLRHSRRPCANAWRPRGASPNQAWQGQRAVASAHPLAKRR